MNSDFQKLELQQLFEFSMQASLKRSGASMIFADCTRQSSFGIVNILNDSAQIERKQFKNSLDFLSQNNILEEKECLSATDRLEYNQKQKNSICEAGQIPIPIKEVPSDDECQQNNQQYQSPNFDHNEANTNSQIYHLTDYFPYELEQILRDKGIPLSYVKCLMTVEDNTEGKSRRRLKVERYLQKRRNKTWNQKICYNCRQKVAEQRLRVHGKFIKKRRAMEILKILGPIPMRELKKLLQKQIEDNNQQIEQLLKKY